MIQIQLKMANLISHFSHKIDWSWKPFLKNNWFLRTHQPMLTRALNDMTQFSVAFSYALVALCKAFYKVVRILHFDGFKP